MEILKIILSYTSKIPAFKIGLIFLGALISYFIIKRFGKVWIMKFIKKRHKIKDKVAIEKRTKTLHHTLTTTLKVVIIFITVLMVLDELKINLAPFIAGAGIVGLAVGFGSQSLVKDFVSGIFILIEDQFRKGDRVKIGNFEGIVEDFTLRRTLLRDDNDNLHYIPNNQINIVSNLTKGKEGKGKRNPERTKK